MYGAPRRTAAIGPVQALRPGGLRPVAQKQTISPEVLLVQHSKGLAPSPSFARCLDADEPVVVQRGRAVMLSGTEPFLGCQRLDCPPDLGAH